MALTLADIQNAPSDPLALNQHLMERGLIPLPPPPAQGLPPATVGRLSPVTPPTAVAPMTPPIVPHEAANVTPMSPRGASLAVGATAQPTLKPLSPVNVGAAPDIGGTPAAPTGDLGIKPMVPPRAPTAQESIQAGMAQHGDTEKEEGKRQFQELRPVVTAPPNSAEFWQQKIAQDEFDKAHPWGSDISAHPGLLGKIGHVAGLIGQTAGAIVAPGAVAQIPGTRINRNIKEQGEETREGQAEQREGQAAERATQAKNVESEIAGRDVTTAEGKAKLEKEQNEQSLEKDAQGNITGYKDAQGKLHSLDEEGTPQAIKDIAEASKSKEGPHIEKSANGDIVQISTDKDGKATSQVVYHGDPKVETELTQRTVNGQEHHVLINKATGQDIKDLGAFKTETSPGQKEKEEQAGEEPVIGYDKDGTQRLMSRAEAKQAGLNHIIKATPKDRDDAEQNASALNDMTAKVRNLRESSKAIDKLGAVQKTLIQAALRGGPDDMSTRLAVSQMSPEAKQFYQDVASLREAALALPKQTTGGARVSEVQAHALWSTIPGSAGDHNFRDSQLRKFDENTERLWRKVPAIEGNKRERAFDENEGGNWKAPEGAPAAPQQDGKVLKDANGNIVARSKGGQWRNPSTQ
jgi:hypothetical protein